MKNIFYAVTLGLALSTPTGSAIAQDKSNEAIENIYKIFQNHAKTEDYKTFQRSLMNNGALHLQSRKNTHVFMSAAASNEFDDGDFRKRLNITTCAAFSIAKLAADWNLTPETPLINLAPNAIETIATATNGASNKIDCRKVYNRYFSHNLYIPN